MSKRKKKSMILPLQGIRAIACLMIFLYHGIGAKLYFGGRWGVSVFFVLSGFVLVRSYWERPVEPTVRNAFAFSAGKIKKLFPLHVLMLLAGLLYGILTRQYPSVKSAIPRLALTVPLLQAWHPGAYQALNTVDWYLSVTLFLYLAFPFILAALKKRSPGMKQTVIVIICIYTVQVAVGAVFNYLVPGVDIRWLVYAFPPYRLGDFAVGCLTGYLFVSGPDSIPLCKKNPSIPEFIALILTVLSWVVYSFLYRSINWFTYSCLFLPFSAILVFVFARGEGIISKLLSNRILISFAGISSCFFLIHRLMLLYVELGMRHLLYVDISKSLLLISAFVLTVLTVRVYQAVDEFRNDPHMQKQQGEQGK